MKTSQAQLDRDTGRRGNERIYSRLSTFRLAKKERERKRERESLGRLDGRINKQPDQPIEMLALCQRKKTNKLYARYVCIISTTRRELICTVCYYFRFFFFFFLKYEPFLGVMKLVCVFHISLESISLLFASAKKTKNKTSDSLCASFPVCQVAQRSITHNCRRLLLATNYKLQTRTRVVVIIQDEILMRNMKKK